MSNAVCVAIVNCANTAHGFTDKASFKEFVKTNEGKVENEVLLILHGGTSATASLNATRHMDWMMGCRPLRLRRELN